MSLGKGRIEQVRRDVHPYGLPVAGGARPRRFRHDLKSMHDRNARYNRVVVQADGEVVQVGPVPLEAENIGGRGYKEIVIQCDSSIVWLIRVDMKEANLRRASEFTVANRADGRAGSDRETAVEHEPAIGDVQGRLPRTYYWGKGWPCQVQLQSFQDQWPLAVQQEVLLLVSLDDRPVAGRRAYRQPLPADSQRRGRERPVATDLDGVAVAGVLDRLGQGVEPPLRDPLAAQPHERARLQIGRAHV